jgi:hypothetical protein
MLIGKLGDLGADAALPHFGTEAAPEAIQLDDFAGMIGGMTDATELDLVFWALGMGLGGAFAAAHRLVLHVVDFGSTPDAAALTHRAVIAGIDGDDDLHTKCLLAFNMASGRKSVDAHGALLADQDAQHMLDDRVANLGMLLHEVT